MSDSSKDYVPVVEYEICPGHGLKVEVDGESRFVLIQQNRHGPDQRIEMNAAELSWMLSKSVGFMRMNGLLGN